VETVNTGYVGFPTVEIFFVMVKNIAVLKYYRINSEKMAGKLVLFFMQLVLQRL
jgi:flagellar basal body rod protein FlgC